MPAYTYLRPDEYTGPCGDDEMDGLMKVFREKSQEDWRLRRITYVTGWLRKKHYVRFVLFHGVGGGEFQAINFHRDDSEWSINHVVPRELIIAYIYGMMGGLEKRVINR